MRELKFGKEKPGSPAARLLPLFGRLGVPVLLSFPLVSRAEPLPLNCDDSTTADISVREFRSGTPLRAGQRVLDIFFVGFDAPGSVSLSISKVDGRGVELSYKSEVVFNGVSEFSPRVNFGESKKAGPWLVQASRGREKGTAKVSVFPLPAVYDEAGKFDPSPSLVAAKQSCSYLVKETDELNLDFRLDPSGRPGFRVLEVNRDNVVFASTSDLDDTIGVCYGGRIRRYTDAAFQSIVEVHKGTAPHTALVTRTDYLMKF